MSDAAPLTGLPLATDEDVLNANASFGNYAKGADTLLIPRYASATIRDATNAAGTTEGQMCVTGSGSTRPVWQQYDGSKWWNIDHGETFYISVGSVTTNPGTTVLSHTIAAGAKYDVEVAIYAACTVATSDLNVTWTKAAEIPAFSRHIQAPNFNNTGNQGPMAMQVSSYNTNAITAVIAGGNQTTRYERCIITGGSIDASVSLVVGLNIAGTAVTIDPRSYATFRRIA